MIPKECKRLAEVDFPIAVVSKHAIREKPVVRRHPQSFHQWWARRPLASCRAMLMALLLPDPNDDACPVKYRNAVENILLGMQGHPRGWESEVKTTVGLRKILLEFIGDFANWDNAVIDEYLRTARALVEAAYPDESPLVVDPFAGGGSIPLEALRLGCEAFASDLSPVACFILKAMLEDLPRREPSFANDLFRISDEMKKEAKEYLVEFYPPDADGSTPIAYLWARTVKCESPNCGAEIPLVRSFWLCKKTNRRRALRYKISRPNGQPPKVHLDIFEPEADSEVPTGTVTRAKATCPCCATVLPPERVRAQLFAQRGGADTTFDTNRKRTGGAHLLAVVTLRTGEQGRHYRLPTEVDYLAVQKAQRCLETIISEWEKGGRKGICPVPDEPLPPVGTLGFRVQRYGMLRWSNVFTARQNLSLSYLSCKVSKENRVEGIREVLALIVSRLSDRLASLVSWDIGGEKLGHVFNRHALPLVWDFAECAPFADATGSYANVATQIIGALESVCKIPNNGQVQIADARESALPDDTSHVWFTDPPYYDAIPYADLADFFFVWLKRCVPESIVLRDPFDNRNNLTPKQREIVQDGTKMYGPHKKDRDFFERSIGETFREGCRVLRGDGIACVVFAHKSTEGWEALLSGLIRGGWVITNSWPIATERANRLRSQQSAALATSIHLVCRPRSTEASVGDWGDVLRELPRRVGDWMKRLQNEGIRGADLVFACIGPALEIYSRYSKVVDPEEREIPLGGDPTAKETHKRGFLAYVWETVGRLALEQVLGTGEARARNGMAGVLEEDARLTALFLWTLQSTNGHDSSNEMSEEEADEDSLDDDEEGTTSQSKVKGFSLVFDVVRRFAQPLGIDLPAWEDRIINTKKGVVRLIAVSDRAKQLFGEDGANAVASLIEQDQGKEYQLSLFPDLEKSHLPKIRGSSRSRRRIDIDSASLGSEATREATTLDRVHAAMLLQAGGQANALRALIKEEQERSSDFLRLANALSALYPSSSEEKRLVDAMLLAVPR